MLHISDSDDHARSNAFAAHSGVTVLLGRSSCAAPTVPSNPNTQIKLDGDPEVRISTSIADTALNVSAATLKPCADKDFACPPNRPAAYGLPERQAASCEPSGCPNRVRSCGTAAPVAEALSGTSLDFEPVGIPVALLPAAAVGPGTPCPAAGSPSRMHQGPDGPAQPSSERMPPIASGAAGAILSQEQREQEQQQQERRMGPGLEHQPAQVSATGPVGSACQAQVQAQPQQQAAQQEQQEGWSEEGERAAGDGERLKERRPVGPLLCRHSELQQAGDRVQVNSSTTLRTNRSAASDPDYEVPRGTMTETQVLKFLAEQQQQLRNQPLRVDKYGFVLGLSAASSDDGPDGDGGRRASGAAASTSSRAQRAAAAVGRALDAATAGDWQPEALRRLREQREQYRLEEQSVGRLRKWRKMLGPNGSGLEVYWRRRPEKFKRRVRKGIPDHWRGLAWFSMSGGKELLDRHPPGTFSLLSAEDQPQADAPSGIAAPPLSGGEGSRSGAPSDAAAALSITSPSKACKAAGQPTAEAVVQPAPLAAGAEAVASAGAAGPAPAAEEPWWRDPLDPQVDASIMRDLNRTFPTNIYFMQRQGPGQRALYTVLRAYAKYEPRVGYVQGMGFLAAVLLLYQDAEEAFWTLVALLDGPRRWSKAGLRWLYTPGMPGLQCCLYQFKHLLRDAVPRLAERMEREGVDPALYATHWFNTAFAYTLPFGHLLRVWDVFLSEGVKTLFRVGLAVLQYAEPRLVRLPFEALVASLSAKNLPALLPEEPEELLRRALRIPISERLAELEAEWQAAQRAGQRPSAAAASGSWRGIGKGKVSPRRRVEALRRGLLRRRAKG